jgi:hypothetical protein
VALATNMVNSGAQLLGNIIKLQILTCRSIVAAIRLTIVTSYFGEFSDSELNFLDKAVGYGYYRGN